MPRVHVYSVCKSAFYHLLYISFIRKLLPTKTTDILVRASFCVLDHSNSLLYNVPMYVVKKLQSFTECCSSAPNFTSLKYYDITPILIELHWLPISGCIKFNCSPLRLHTDYLLLTFKIDYMLLPIQNTPVIL